MEAPAHSKSHWMATSVKKTPPSKKPAQLFPEIKPELLKGLKLSGEEDETLVRLLQARHVMKSTKLVSVRPLLPLLLSLKGKPLTLKRYFPVEPFYRTRMPRKTIMKAGRQVSKSLTLAARNIILSNCIPFFSTLFITPQFEMVRRFSTNYVRPLIDQSPVRSLMVNSSVTHSVLQRTFRNNAQMIFSFAFLSADRTRGISSDQNVFDECQDLDISHLPIINESMSGSDWKGLETYAGTPKGLENCVEALWRDSSQAEWCIRCVKCRHWNVPTISHDLDRMIGPWSPDISMENPGVVCAKCRQPRSIFPHQGRYIHAFPEKRWSFSGYHIPQLIMPMHYADPEKWATLLAKREGSGNYTANKFYNEVCGESYDTGSRIVTLTELKAAAVLPWRNDVYAAVEQLDRYMHRVLAADWGGGGQDEVSFTSLAVLGYRPDGKIDVIWGHRSLTPHDHVGEARLCLAALSRFQCHMFAHDYTGAGSLRETLIVQAGYPLERIVNVSYLRAAASAKVMTFKPMTRVNPRSYYQVDKARSLLLTCNQIKTGWLQFFQWDYVDNENQGLIYDFLGLVDEKVDSRIGKDIYTIIRDPNMRDDFAQAVNIGCCTLWNMTDKWPNIAAIAALQMDQATLDAIEPENAEVMLEDLI